MAVAIAPGPVWAQETGDGSPAVDAGSTNPPPATAPDGQSDGGVGPDEPSGGTTTSTTTTGTESTTVIGGGGSPEVTISASTVDTSGTTTAQTPESAGPIGDKVAEVIHRWERATQDFLVAAADPPTTVPDPVGDASFEPAPAPTPPTMVLTPAVATETAPAGDPQPSTAPGGEPTGTTMLTMLTTLANVNGGSGQIGLPMISLSVPNDAQALTATKFAADVPTLDFPAPPPQAIVDKSLWTIPGRSTADIIMLAVALSLAATLFAAWAFSSARSRALQPPSGGWRAVGRHRRRLPVLSRLLR